MVFEMQCGYWILDIWETSPTPALLLVHPVADARLGDEFCGNVSDMTQLAAELLRRSAHPLPAAVPVPASSLSRAWPTVSKSPNPYSIVCRPSLITE